jgi:uncharacterized protein YceH (UPF0502 family)
MSEDIKKGPWVPLNARERRVLGVLIEKQKTTPEYYPLSVAALLTGCNQRSNRDPVTSYDIDDVEDALHSLRQKGLAVLVEGSGRVVRWKHQAYDSFGLRGKPAEMAVLAELLLRGAQTEGELRQRASRMDEIADLPALQGLLATLAEMGLVVTLSPAGQKRGVVVAHTLYPSDELERLRTAHAAGRHEAQDAPPGALAAPGGRFAAAEEFARLRAEIDELRALVQGLDEDLRRLKAGLGETP